MSSLRADNVGDIVFIDDAYVKIRSATYTVFIIVDGTTTFVTAFAPRTKDSRETIQCLMEWMGTFHCAPLSVCADMVFSPLKFEISSVVSTSIISTGPYTPWPNRAEAAVRVFRETLHYLCSQVGSSLELKQVTVR